MSKTIEAVISRAMIIAFFSIVLFSVYTMFVWGPVSLYAEAKCLEKGYADARVSIGLSIYCTRFSESGAVTVEKL